MSRFLAGALIGLAAIAFAIIARAEASQGAEVVCTVVPPRPAPDCSLGASLKRGWTPLECHNA